MFESIIKFFRGFGKNEKENSKTTAKERLHLVLAQDRANISADFLEMMKQEIIEVIKKYIDIDEEAIDVRMTNKPGEDGIVGAPALYANIPIVTIKNETRKIVGNIVKEKQENTKIQEIQEKQENTQKQEIQENVEIQQNTKKPKDAKTQNEDETEPSKKNKGDKINIQIKETVKNKTASSHKNK